MNCTDEKQLMQLIQKDDQMAFRSLFNKYADHLEQYVTCLIHDRNVAREIVLDIYTHLWEHRSTFQLRVSLRSYLYQSARNNAYYYLRGKRESIYLDDLQLADEEDTDSSLPEIEKEELYQLIQRTVCHLPTRCLEIFRMSREEEMSNKEIARQLNLSEKTVETQISIALRKIRSYLA